MHATLARKLKALRACKEAVVWAEGREWPAAWQECERGDWMLWLCSTKSWPERKAIVRVACDCAELVLPIYENNHPNDSRVRDCIETTRKWTCGEATLEDVRNARNTVYTIYTDGSYIGASFASLAAVYAAFAAAAAATSYTDASHVTTAAADAASLAADADPATRFSTLKQCADICRKHLAVPGKL